jgi:hypothetical protein
LAPTPDPLVLIDLEIKESVNPYVAR